MHERVVGGLAAVVVGVFLTELAVGVASAEDPLSRTFVLGALNAVAWYGLTALAATWLFRGDAPRRSWGLAILASQALTVVPALVLPLVGDLGPLPLWLVVSLVGDAVIVAAGAASAWLLIRSGAASWDLWRWQPTRLAILMAAGLLALAERMPRFETPETAALESVEVSILSRIVSGPMPWRLVEIVSLVTVLTVGFAAATLRPRRLAVAVGAALAVPAVPQLLSVALDPGTGTDPTAWLWAQTAAVVILCLALVFLATSADGYPDPERPTDPLRA
ncbi:MAG: hypothetical protein KY437_02575 [Actinobacteria bacterium]|nr:hypothetical protein [Actinomycetota bacterium]